MQRFVAILGQPESDLARQVASRLQERGITVGLLNLDAAHDGGAVSILPGGVLWEGFDLSRADAVLVERPDFAWQSQVIDRLVSIASGDHDAFIGDSDERELLTFRVKDAPLLVIGSMTVFGVSFVEASYQYLRGLYSQRLTGAFFSTD